MQKWCRKQQIMPINSSANSLYPWRYRSALSLFYNATSNENWRTWSRLACHREFCKGRVAPCQPHSLSSKLLNNSWNPNCYNLALCSRPKEVANNTLTKKLCVYSCSVLLVEDNTDITCNLALWEWRRKKIVLLGNGGAFIQFLRMVTLVMAKNACVNLMSATTLLYDSN